MSVLAPRIEQGTTDQRRLLAAVGILTLAVALLVAVTISQQIALRSAPAQANGAHELIINSPSGGSLRYTGIPYPPRSQVVGGTQYTGIPYVPTQQISTQYTGIPFTPTRKPDVAAPNRLRMAQ
jgi:hypothetical protein